MANQYIHSLTDTWNEASTDFAGIKMNVTDTASVTGSRLIDLQISGSSKFKVDKAGNQTLTSDDAGASAGPLLTLRRDSASPAASDILGKLLFQGEDSAGNTEDYAEIYSSIVDPTSASEDANIQLRAKVAGTMTTLATLAAAALTLGTDVALAFAGTGAATTRTNLGLGSAALKATGASGDAVPLLNVANTWSALQTFNADIVVEDVIQVKASSGSPFIQFRDGSVQRGVVLRQMSDDTIRLRVHDSAGTQIGSDLSWSGSTLIAGHIIQANNTGSMSLSGGNSTSAGANIELYGGSHASQANNAFYDAAAHTFRSQSGGSGTSLTVNGDITATGDITANSDESLKTDWQTLPDDFLELLAKAKAGTFTRIDSGARQVGVGARSFLPVIPEAVRESRDGVLSLAYGQAALVATVELARELIQLRDKVAAMEQGA